MREAVLFLASILFPGILSCQDNMCMCLTWKIKNSSLILTCKVSNLEWPIILFDTLKRELGFCLSPIPDSHCIALSKTVSIHQNRKTNETIFYVTGPLDHRINGNWTCQHGSRGEFVTTEVTLFNFNHQDCWPLLLVFTFSGFFLFYVLSQLFIYTLFSPCIGSSSDNSWLKTLGNKIWKGRKSMIERITDLCICLQKNKEFSMKAIKGTFVCLLMVLMIAIPVVVGISEKGMCSENLSFIPIGFVFGFIVRMFLMDEKGTDREQSFINGCCCLMCKRKEKPNDQKEHDNWVDDEEKQTNQKIPEEDILLRTVNVTGTTTESDT